MGGALEDLERRIDQARAEAQRKKLIQEQEKARQEAEKLQRQRNQNSSSWLL
jgi:hypothetical protein